MSVLFLLVSLVGAWFTFNAYRPMLVHRRRSVISFFAGWLTTELALHQIFWQLVATVVFVWMGALAEWPGKLGLVITLASWIALGAFYLKARGDVGVVEDALVSGLGATYRDEIRAELASALTAGVNWREVALPFLLRDPAVERIRDIKYSRASGLDLKLDIYRAKDPARRASRGMPVLLQVHGGGWVLGSKNEQGVPLMLRMARHGWMCVSIDYRLSPAATFPEHVIDVKRSIQWIREHAAEYGADPEFIVITGGSAGGHLASLTALTPNAPEFQPGFESVDTHVRGCVSFYGVYDFTDRQGVYRHEGLRRVLERWVMKASLEEARERYEQASPIYRITPEAPPFFITHGVLDSLVPVGEAREFSAELRRVSRAPVVYAEIPAAQHAFEIFHSLRSNIAINGVERFLIRLYEVYLRSEAQQTDHRQQAAS